MAGMTSEQFTDKVKEIFVDSVTPLLEDHGKTLESVQAEIDDKI